MSFCIVDRYTKMLRAHTTVTKIWQHIDKKMIPSISVCRKLPRWQCTVGKNIVLYLLCILKGLYEYHACVSNMFTSPVGAVRWKSRQAPLLTASPVRALIDDQISIKGRFLPPRCPVTVHAQMQSEDGDVWEAFAHYNTDASGTVSCE